MIKKIIKKATKKKIKKIKINFPASTPYTIGCHPRIPMFESAINAIQKLINVDEVTITLTNNNPVINVIATFFNKSLGGRKENICAFGFSVLSYPGTCAMAMGNNLYGYNHKTRTGITMHVLEQQAIKVMEELTAQSGKTAIDYLTAEGQGELQKSLRSQGWKPQGTSFVNRSSDNRITIFRKIVRKA